MPQGLVWNYPRAAAQLAARSGFDAQAAYDVLSSLGMTVSRGQWGTLYGQAQRSISEVGYSGEYPTNLPPTADMLQPISTVSATGYGVQVLVTAVDQKTGDTISIPYTARSSDIITGEQAIAEAIDAQITRGKDYKYDVQSAQVTGYYQYVPWAGK